MEDFRSYHIVLSSSAAINEDSSNTHSNFTTNFKTPIKLQREVFEVGVAEIFFNPVQDIFLKPGDNEIAVVEQPRAEVKFIKGNNLSSDIANFNSVNKKANTGIRIDMILQNEKNHVQLSQTLSNNVRMKPDATFRKMFGFSKKEYNENIILGENEFNIDEYAKIKNGTTATIIIYRPPQEKQSQLFFVKNINLPIDIMTMNQAAVRSRVPVVTTTTVRGKQLHYQIEQKFGNQFGIRLDKNLQRMLGFKKTEYMANKIIAENPIDPTIYQSFQQGTKLSLTIFEPIDKKVLKIEQVHEYSPEGFVTSLNETFMNAGYRDIICQLNDERITLEKSDTLHALRPSQKILDILNTNETELFPGFASGKINLYVNCEKIIIYSNISFPQIYSSYRKNLLRVIPHEREREHQHLIFNPIQYSPISECEINSIQIDLKTEVEETIEFDHDVTIVLHIRPRSL